jgi:hypothetical protein
MVESGQENTYLDDNFHKIFLSNNVLALDNLLKNGREDAILIEVQVDTVEL